MYALNQFIEIQRLNNQTEPQILIPKVIRSTKQNFEDNLKFNLSLLIH